MSLPEPLAPFPGPVAARREGLTVFVRGLEVQAGIGVHAHEQGVLQTLILDVTLELGPRPVERLSDTVNYETVAQAAAALVADGHIGLVETFAERLALACLDDPRVRRVTVRVEKPGCLPGAVAAGCEVAYAR
ncbi:dihydroneopterin aldolase [Brevundimonas balnearis]|uniref:7,8-dihydroneopterin aldolase n=1 Tax=Brevundimonas balnearis TaxID=1572858 RepID=A0ABV6R013_9CAUL